MSFISVLGNILIGAILLLTLMGLVISFIMPGIDRWNRTFFIILHSILIFGIVFTIIDTMIYGIPDYRLAEVVTVYIESLLFSLPFPMTLACLLHCSGEKWERSPAFLCAFTLWCVYFVLLGIAQFTEDFFYITPENTFCQGPYYLFLLVPLFVVILINLIVLFKRRTCLPRKYYILFLNCFLFTILGMVLQLFFNTVMIMDIGVAICCLAIFIINLSDQFEQYMNQQREIADQRASIMVLQMRPHFIYNTITSIYYLCDQDPKKAQSVILDFTTYLRKNFSAIASEDTIPFTEELEHTRAYLAVEQAQFEESLFVNYDTPHTYFRLPPLTLQPIVENAVKHGMDPDSEPLHITVRTRKTEEGSVITVEDNGTGFENEDDNGLHIALANIKQRLNIMCHGKLEITSGEGSGTVVKVIIP